MSPERWQQIEEIFQNALDLSPSERAPYISEKCVDDAELKIEVEKLLAQFEDASSFIETPAYNDTKGGVLSRLMDFDEEDPMLGTLLGSYRINSEIGRGGMGAVYEAVRADGEFRRKVAIKVVKRGMDTDFILRRFRNERQILATLEHPYITRLLDGGTTDDGRPYFVMDYIEGLPLYRYCDKNRLTIEERLKLFVKICEAVEYAHQNLVIHRDLKPSNILVSSDATPRLLDFGIAKLLNPEMASDTLQPTATAMRMMTIDYASPEQIQGEKVTFSTDIYSLGIILFELLTGHRPYRFPNRTPHEMARVICEEPPSLPSSAIIRSENTLPIIQIDEEAITIGDLAELRSKSLDTLQKELEGNLDNITVKALNKLPADRYESVKKFRDDIEQHLHGNPVSAPFYLPVSKTEDVQTNQEGRVIAVLPLKLLNQSAAENTDENYLSLGLTDALISRLSNVGRLTVRPTTSVLRFQDQATSPFSAGRILQVEYVIDGNIRRVGERVRVSLQLLDVAKHSTIWAEKFDEKFTDVLELEDVISERVVKMLLPRLTGEEQRRLEKRGTNNVEAYQTYLRGRYFANLFSGESLLKSIECYREAIRLDPNYALPHVGIADFYIWSAVFGEMACREAYPQAKAEIERALKINDSLGEAYALKAFVTLLYDWNWAEAERLVKRALELNPNFAFAHECYSNFFSTQGKFDEAVREIRIAEELDPLSPRAKLMSSWTLYQAQRFSESVAKAKEANDMQENFSQGLLHLGNAQIDSGEIEESVKNLRKAVELWTSSALPKYMLCFALIADNQLEEARKVLEDIKKTGETGHLKPYYLGMAYTAFGEIDLAFEWFEKSFESRDEWFIWFGVDPKLKPIRKDPRYLTLLRKTNNPIVKHLTEKAIDAPTTNRNEKSVAVLPFKLFGLPTNSSDGEYLGIGLTDALITRLSKAKQLVVRPTSSVLYFDKTTDDFGAGKELGVRYVLSGNIRYADELIRVSVQLLDVERNSTEWAENFDQNMTDMLELEDSISEQVVKSLLPQLTDSEQQKLSQRGTDNPKAYEAYLKGRFYWNQFTSESLPKAIECFQKAVELDPNYALAHVGIADFYIWANIYGLIPPTESAKLAETAIKKALAIDDKLGEAYTTYGLIKHNEFNWEEGRRLHEKAIELNPNYSHAHEWNAANLVGSGNFAEGIKEIERAESIDPLSLRTKTLVAWTKSQAHDFEASLAKANEIIALDANYPQGHLQRGHVLFKFGRYEEAIASVEKALALMPQSDLVKYFYCFVLAGGNRLQEARKIYDGMRNSTRYVKPLFLGYASVAVGEIDEAFRYFNQAADEFDPWLVWFGVDFKLDPIRRDRRYLDLLRRMKNPLLKQFEEKYNQEKSIAVLPFEFIGETETGEAYLTIGLADAMITRLSRIKGLNVRPTSSIVRFYNQDITINKIAEELNVDFVLKGHLKKFGKRLRVTVQLLDVAQNTTIWAETIDETLDDVLLLEDSICYKVLRSLTLQLTGAELNEFEKRGTTNRKAYEAYLRGRFHWLSYTVDGIAKALVCYYEAIAEDENFALAYSGVADYYNFLSIFGVMSPEESFPSAKEAAEKAISLDRNLAEAYTSLGITTYGYDWDFQKAKRYLEKSLKLNPNSSEAHLWYGYLFGIRGEHEKAIAEFERAESLSPQSPSVRVSYALTLRNARQYEKGREKLYQALEIQPDNPTALQGFCWFVNALGNFEEAEEMCKKAVEVSNRQNLPLYAYGYTLASVGKTDEARKIIEELEARSKTQYVPPIYLALIHTTLGEINAAFEWLEKCFEIRDFWVIWLPIDPRFDDLRKDKRFKEFCQRIQPLNKPDETIHQSQIETKIFTADELKVTKPEETEEKEQIKPSFFYRHRFKFATAAVLFLLTFIAYASGVLTIDFQDRRFELEAKKSANAKRSVAILPFKNETANPENDYLCDGLSDSLISRLSHLSDLQLIPRSTSFNYKSKNLTPQQAGAEMNVETVLSGKLVKHDAEFEINIELVDVKNGSKIWGFGYRGGDADLLFLQNKMLDNIAEKFSSADVKQTLTKSYTENTEAFELYLKGEYHRQKSTPEDTKKAVDFYKKALEKDSNYALAYQGLALTYRMSPAYGTLSPNEAYPMAKEAAMKTLSIDPTLGAAHIPLASIKFAYDWDFAGAEAEYKQAIQFAPNNAEAHYSYGNFLVAMGRSDEALSQLRIAQQFDPLSITIASNIAWALYVAGRFNEAEIQIKQVLERDPNYARAYMSLGEIYQEQGKFDESIAAFQKSKQLSNEVLADMALGHVYAMSGRKAEAQKIAAELEAKVLKKEVSPFLPAVVYAALKENDKAFYWLERAFQERSNWLTLTKAGHRLKPLHGDPRFDDLLKRIGFEK